MYTLIEVLPVIVLITHFIDKYLLSKGLLLPVYILMIVGSLASAAFNILLYLEQNRLHNSLLLFSANSAWAIVMGP